MKDIFNHAEYEQVIKDYNLIVLNTKNHKYLCFIQEQYIERLKVRGCLSGHLQISDYVIRDGELMKSKLTVIE